MPKKAKEISAIAVKRLTKAGLHAVGGVDGLMLQVRDSGAKSWILRARVNGKRRDIGLGSFSDIGLSDVREKARGLRNKIKEGVDPVLARKEARSAMLAASEKAITFRAATEEYITAKSSEWKNAKHTQQWGNTLEAYAYPIIGKLHVKDVEMTHVLKIIEPIWQAKTETAARLRGRIEAVLDWAAVRGYRGNDNPARWKGFLDKVLPAPGKISPHKHHKALPFDEVAIFMEDIKKREGISARALEFLILTAARSGEVRGATWEEIDLQEKIWTIPVQRMKAGKEHRVPLAPRAVALLEALPHLEGCNFVFPSTQGGMLSDMALAAVMRRMGKEAVPHGFRSTFRDWVSERTAYPRDVAEMALAHTIGNKVEAAYRRGDLFEKRKRMMNEWARFCNTVQGGVEIVAIGRRR